MAQWKIGTTWGVQAQGNQGRGQVTINRREQESSLRKAKQHQELQIQNWEIERVSLLNLNYAHSQHKGYD